MTGPEHFKEAERLINAVTKPGALLPASRVLQPGDHGDTLALAQVHATLANAAATADALTLPSLSGDDAKYDDWRDATYYSDKS